MKNKGVVSARLDELIATQKYSSHPFIRDIAELKPTKVQLGAWALQKYFQVKDQNKIFSRIHTYSDNIEIRQYLVDQLRKETSIKSGSAVTLN